MGHSSQDVENELVCCILDVALIETMLRDSVVLGEGGKLQLQLKSNNRVVALLLPKQLKAASAKAFLALVSF